MVAAAMTALLAECCMRMTDLRAVKAAAAQAVAKAAEATAAAASGGRGAPAAEGAAKEN